ncbi:hypothetical protein TNCT_378261 [Trichonephila clavata]|uniref:Uncharacterized protein n=1 Tax=Trichonephila clavata TaxID=2740835 RepID=A0A8X6LEX2_TRICU|nr:hypothetical protein TNCT_378261 [Trichonephila clavata]
MEDLRYIAPIKRRAKVIISDFEIENDLDAIDTSSDKEISPKKVTDGTLWETLNESRPLIKRFFFSWLKIEVNIEKNTSIPMRKIHTTDTRKN